MLKILEASKTNRARRILEARRAVTERGGLDSRQTSRIQTLVGRALIVADKPLTTDELVRQISTLAVPERSR